ncbi:hypothetical protein [Bacillus pinisoli]|uniref:hypothetical protein n=1 Tax=Bacillus pinisoli TaxID=2901866 RepID=UPI001FF26093|nr:hypothetical protein [Bacillus pinisoli]
METNALSHKQIAVKCFNKVWDYLDQDNRTVTEEEEMIHLCHTSFWHWTQVEEHTLKNLSIGYWQLSRVYSIVGNGKEAITYATRCVSISKEGEIEPFYISYAYEALARAQVLVNQIQEAEESLKLADHYKQSVPTDYQKALEDDIANVRKQLLTNLT